MINQKIFTGGIRVGLYSATWPNGILEVDNKALVLRDKSRKKKYEFSRDDVVRIELKKIFPIIGYGLRIHHNRTDYKSKVYFWYVSFRFGHLVEALKELGWL